MTDGLVRELQIETTRRGYWVAIGLVVASVGIGALMFWRLYATVAAMPRVDARGEHVVTLPAGELVVFGELPDGVASTSGLAGVSVRCGAKDASGSALHLQNMGSTSISYDVGSHAGQSMFELDARAGGPVTITCESDEDLVLAFGKGIGKIMLVGILLGMLSFLSGGFVLVRTFLRRRRDRRRAADLSRSARAQ